MDAYLSQKQINAIKTMDNILNQHNIPYVIIGGLAALAHGVKRTLVDIDIQVRENDIETVREVFKDYIQTDLRHYKTDHWNIIQMILNIDGVTVDVCQQEGFTCIKDSNEYHLPHSIDTAYSIEFQKKTLPVLPRNILIEYKKFIYRDVDRADLEMLT